MSREHTSHLTGIVRQAGNTRHEFGVVYRRHASHIAHTSTECCTRGYHHRRHEWSPYHAQAVNTAGPERRHLPSEARREEPGFHAYANSETHVISSTRYVTAFTEIHWRDDYGIINGSEQHTKEYRRGSSPLYNMEYYDRIQHRDSAPHTSPRHVSQKVPALRHCVTSVTLRHTWGSVVSLDTS